MELRHEAKGRELDEVTNRKMATAMAIAGAVIIPVSLIISGIFAGWKGLAGAFVGLAVASLNTVLAFATIRWVVKKPPAVMPTLMLGVMWGRLILLCGVLFGLTYVKALDTLCLLFSFLALFIAYTVVEVVFSYKGFSTLVKSGKDESLKL
jgi:hypothetical protein